MTANQEHIPNGFCQPLTPGEAIIGRSTNGLGYVLRLPPRHTRRAIRWPLMFFFHGGGWSADEMRDDPRVNLRYANTPLTMGKKWALYNEVVVVAPQCKAGHREDDIGWWGFSYPSAIQDSLSLLDELMAREDLQLDSNRVYLTGLSMGGAAVWDLADAAPARFAAVVPICPKGARTEEEATAKSRRLAATRIPQWVVVADNDDYGAEIYCDHWMQEGRAAYAEATILGAGGGGVGGGVSDGERLMYTKYDAHLGHGHASWVPGYREEEIWSRWILQYTNQRH